MNFRTKTIKGVEFPDESSADVYTDSIDITNAEISVGQNPELLVAGQFGSLNIAGTCTPQEIISVAKTLITKKVCQGPCHCASTAFRILRLAGCNTKMSGSANGGKSALEKSTWITKPCTDFPAEKIPVGYLWKDGHAMISIGGGQLVESSTDITKCWKSQKAAKTCKAKGEKEFDQCAIENGECPKSNQLAVGQAYCNSCSLISGEGPETCRFSNGQGCKGGGTCVSNQCIYKSGLGRIKKIYNSCTITYKPGWETSGNVTYSDSVSESSESIGSSGH
ncbi:hypothetical protein HZB94_00275 [Candidatus Falkowbacteria bacterium]|nr:hypothetical protein [Candidatus Falkowbacteria bacterium]